MSDTTLNDALKPCPFCGVKPKLIADMYCYCQSWGCASRVNGANLAAWNTRSNTPDSPSQPSEAAIRNALLIAKEALIDADIAIKGREHTGFIYKALAEIGVALQSDHASDAAQPVKGE